LIVDIQTGSDRIDALAIRAIDSMIL